MGGPDTYLTNFTHALVGTVKHYAAYGMSAGGIDGSPADLSEQKLREMYLSPWEYLADGRGLVVPPGDVAAFRDALQSVLSDPELRDRTAASALQTFEQRYSASAVFPRMEDLWLAALRDRHSAA